MYRILRQYPSTRWSSSMIHTVRHYFMKIWNNIAQSQLKVPWCTNTNVPGQKNASTPPIDLSH